MHDPATLTSPPRAAIPIAALTLAFLAACGGGGAGDGSVAGQPTVTSAAAGPVKYSQSLLVTIEGSGLDSGLTVSSPGCKGMALSTQKTEVSSASRAYYRCTASALGANVVNVASKNGALLKSADFFVAVPQVTMAVKNGLGVDGLMVFTLAPDKAPVTVDNFLAYVNSGFYDGTVFHRVLAGFVIQGGGYLPITPGSAPVPQTPLNDPIDLEVGRGLSNSQWTIAMARVDRELKSATSQFFINVADNSAGLDPGGNQGDGSGYAVFGSLSAGTAVASAILGAPCAPMTGFSECVPNPNIEIKYASQTQ